MSWVDVCTSYEEGILYWKEYSILKNKELILNEKICDKTADVEPNFLVLLYPVPRIKYLK